MNNCGGSLIGKTSGNQSENGGSSPTSPLQLFMQPISRKLACEIYTKWHYLKTKKFLASYHFGAYYNGELLGAISYGIMSAPAMKGLYNKNNQKGWWEIKRLAMDDKCPKNSESRFIAITIKLIRRLTNVKGIVTYADTKVGHTGTIYKASGFEYRGLTASKSDYFVGKKNWGATRNWKNRPLNGEWKPRSRKHLFVKIYKNEK